MRVILTHDKDYDLMELWESMFYMWFYKLLYIVFFGR